MSHQFENDAEVSDVDVFSQFSRISQASHWKYVFRFDSEYWQWSHHGELLAEVVESLG